MIANTLVICYMLLGGHVEEETFWAIDKSYVLVSMSFPSLIKVAYSCGSLEVVLSHLSKKLVHVIADGRCLKHLNYLLGFLAVWEKRPGYLTLMAYQWCCTISEAVERVGLLKKILCQQPKKFQCSLDDDWDLLPLRIGENGFLMVGPACDPVRLNDTSHSIPSCQQEIALHYYEDLHKSLEIGFRLAGPDDHRSTTRFDQPSHNDWMFEAAFSSDDTTPLSSFARSFHQASG